MRILSFDIGIKNLAWCLAESRNIPSTSGISNECCWKILDWGVWDLRVDVKDEIYHPEFCCATTSSGRICGRVPMYSDLSGDVCLGGYCKTHLKHCEAFHTNEDIRKLPKTPIAQLRGKATSLNIDIKGMKKSEIVSKIGEIYRKRCVFKIPKLVNSRRIGLETIHNRIIQRVKDIHCSADLIFIENQPVKMNATMKTIQIILWTTLRERMIRSGIINPKVRFLNANKKLMVRPNDEAPWNFEILTEEVAKREARRRSYSERKKESITRVSTILTKTGQDCHHKWFERNPKKDDLADCLLMCLWGMCD